MPEMGEEIRRRVYRVRPRAPEVACAHHRPGQGVGAEGVLQGGLRGEGSPKAIGFIYPNASASRKMFSYATTVDEVEQLTGIDFFPALRDDVEDKVEATRGYF